MLELRVLEGNEAGNRWVARHFPVRIGRSDSMDLRLEDPGVWEEHAEISFDDQEGFIIQPLSGGTMYVNDAPTAIAPLKNGDTFQLGDVILQLWLTSVPQRGLAVWETGFWTLLTALTMVQVLLIYWLTR